MYLCLIVLGILLMAGCGSGDQGDIQTDMARIHADDCTLTWNPYPVQASFNIYTSTTSGLYSAPQVMTNNLTMTCSGMGVSADNQTHYFVVTALVNGRESPHSNEVSKFLRSNGHTK